MQHFFPLPYKGQNGKALPGLSQVSPPSARPHTTAKKPEQTWQHIVTLAQKEFTKWLPSGEWWERDAKHACEEEGFMNLFQEALTIRIEIKTEEEQDAWCFKLFEKQLHPQDTWLCYKKGNSHNKIIELSFAPMPETASAAISPHCKCLPVVYGNLNLKHYSLIAINSNLRELSKKSPIVAQNTAKILRALAESIEAAVNTGNEKPDTFHRSAMASILYSWWVKRGGSNKKFPEFAQKLGLTQANNLERKSDLSETFATKARERLDPVTLLSLQTFKQVDNDIQQLKKFLKI